MFAPRARLRGKVADRAGQAVLRWDEPAPSEPLAQRVRLDGGHFSFNVAKGRCETCEGEGFVSIELLFMPSVCAPCPTCHGARYNAKTLEVSIATGTSRRCWR